MTRVYRVLRRPYAETPFDGEGAYRYGGRWSSAGTRIAYTSEHQALAMLEYLVHLDANDPPPDLVLAVADVPDDLKREQITATSLPTNWRDTPAPSELVRYGDEFVKRVESLLLLVPSALAPSEDNWLINPLHPDFRKVRVLGASPLIYDSRLSDRGRREHKRK